MTEGLGRWLFGGLTVGVVIVGLMVAAYAVGYHRGERHVSANTRPTRTAAKAPSRGTTSAATDVQAQLAVGKQIMSTTCASCHTLAAAGAQGTVGPNLDSLKPGYQIVLRQVINGGGQMPAFGKEKILTQAQIVAVARYVSQFAGKK